MKRCKKILGSSSATKYIRAPVRGVGVRGRGLRDLGYTILLQSHLAIRNAKSSGFFVGEGEVFGRNSL